MSNTHNRVAHAWANQTGKQCKGFNMYYEGATLYSYGRHFPIAMHTVDTNGAHVVLFTTNSHSVSTAKHKTIARRACNHLTVFNVPNVRAVSVAEHNLNHEYLIEEARDLVAKAKRARKYGDMLLRDAEQSLTQANDYSVAFGLGHPIIEMVNLDAGIADIRRRQAEREATLRAEREARNREHKRQQRVRNNPEIVAWLNGAATSPVFYDRGHTLAHRPFVRVKGDKVETSWGAVVPLDAALDAFRIAAKCRAKGQAFEPGLRTIRLGDFALRRIGPTGNLVVGCHDIPYRHMKLAADRAGIVMGEMGVWMAESNTFSGEH